MLVAHSDSILIIGGGTWGCSTALHLARRGYMNVTVLDSHAQPAAISAGNDVSKIVELVPEGAKPAAAGDVAAILHQAASKGWRKDPVFAPYFHETGLIVAGSSDEALEEIGKKEAGPLSDPAPEQLDTTGDFRRAMPEGVFQGDFPGWHGFFARRGCGWAQAGQAMEAARAEAERLGVRFVDNAGHGDVVQLIYGGEDQDVIGARTADGRYHVADHIVLAAGAAAPQIAELHNQLRPTAWTLGRIALSPAEAALFRDMPVLFNIEQGFCTVDADRRELTVCDEHPGYCNWVYDANKPWPVSVPVARDGVPASAERRMRALLREAMPQLADRPLASSRLCWCADTPDRHFLITRHPTYRSLVLAVGDSGHGYMHIPSIGGFVADCLEDCLAEPLAKAWRWRPETADRFWGNDPLNRMGAGNRVMDLREDEEDMWSESV